MRILGFDISRRGTATTLPATVAPVPATEVRAAYGPFYNTIAAWRSSVNFTTSAPGYGLANPWEAMGVPAVFACVDKIAKTIAATPKAIYDIRVADQARHLVGTPLGTMIAAKPNGYQTSFIFWHLVIARLLLWGNFYAEIQRDPRSGEAIGLWPLLNQDVTPELVNGQKVFRVAGVTLADDDVFHVMAPGFNGVTGISRIAMHRSAVRTALEMQGFTEGLYRNGMKSPGAFVLPTGQDELSAEAFARLRESIDESYTGALNAGRPLLLEGGMTFAPLAMPLGDAEFVATKRYGIAEIARIFDMPLHKIAEMDGAKFNNVEQQNLSFVIDCIEPLLVMVAQEANAKLPAPADRGVIDVRFSTDHLLRGDMASRMTAFATARQWSVMTINEVRRKLGLNGIGPEGDAMFVPGNANAAAPALPATAPAADPPVPTGDE